MAKSGVGVIDPKEQIVSSYKIVTKAAPGYANERTVEPPKRRKRAAITIPTDHPISMGDMVIARDYLSGGSYRKQFAGTGIVRAITVEQRRSFSDGKVRDYRRMTVIVEGRRFDLLEECLQYVGTPPAPQAAPVAPPQPLPLAIMVVNVTRQRGKAVNTVTPDVIRLRALTESGEALAAAEARAAIRAEYEREHGVTLPPREPVEIGRRKLWMRNEDGTITKREVVS